MYWTRMRERASKPLEEKMLSLVGGHDILLKASLHDDEYSNYYVYKEDWFFIPGQEWIRYDFMIEYNLRDPNLGIYYGCRCVSDWGSDHEAAIELADRHWAALREEVTAVLNATFPDIDFSRQFRLSDNANDHTYWPFWIRLEEGENITEVAIRALKLIRTVYARYLGERVRDEDWVMTDGTPTRFTHPALNSLVSRVDDIIERYGGERKGMAFQREYGNIRTPYLDNNYSEFKRMINILDNLGYSQLTDEEYEQNVENTLKNIENKLK